jgi:hypothetical protein
MVSDSFHGTAEAIACQADSFLQINAEHLLDILPEIGFPLYRRVIDDLIFEGYSGSDDSRRVAPLNHLRA